MFGQRFCFQACCLIKFKIVQAMNKKLFSLTCALITSILWGSAFIAQDMGMDFIGPYTFSVGRFLVGFLSLVPFFLIFEFKKIKLININKKKIYISCRTSSSTNLINLYRCCKYRCVHSYVCIGCASYFVFCFF
jgi:drug/metabolite transporter (DMT)-like permease